ncbi:hypothetical protein [Pseudoalteromonas ulvae]|uniref:hypothetical protein n=1 Tax=Pseudoalteromonas ulvae TaxID=107327 RepID=UPI00186B657A|nr:hypothetical protein [Pseudoalteromonas ulvae]
MIGNTSQDPILMESRLVITDCSFIGNLCFKAMDDKGNELNILYFSPNFDTTFKDRYWLKPNKIIGLYILKEDLSLMLSLKKKSKITLQFLYHNKSNDNVFKSIPIKVNLP